MTPSVRASLRDLAAARPDLLIIGGGITRAGIARDAAPRGVAARLGGARGLGGRATPALGPAHPRGAPLPRAGSPRSRHRGAPGAGGAASPRSPPGPPPAVRPARLSRGPAFPLEGHPRPQPLRRACREG